MKIIADSDWEYQNNNFSAKYAVNRVLFGVCDILYDFQYRVIQNYMNLQRDENLAIERTITALTNNQFLLAFQNFEIQVCTQKMSQRKTKNLRPRFISKVHKPSLAV